MDLAIWMMDCAKSRATRGKLNFDFPIYLKPKCAKVQRTLNILQIALVLGLLNLEFECFEHFI